MFPVSDWTISLFFLLALILTAKFKRQIGSVDPTSYRDISWGLSILAIVSLLKLYRGVGVLDDVPFISHAAFYDLVCWIGMISGITLIIGGVSSWLPIARSKHQTAEARISRLEFVQSIEQHVAVEGRIRPILATTLQRMIEHFQFSDGAVFTTSARRKYLQPVSHTLDSDMLYAVNFSGERFSGNDLAKLSGLPRDLPAPHIVLPVMHDSRVVALFALWADEQTVCNEAVVQSLKIAAGIIARKISTEHLRLRNSFEEHCNKLTAAFERNLPLASDLTAGFRETANVLAQGIPFDTISLTYLTKHGDRFNRITLGPSGSLLAEKEITWQGSDSIVGRVFVSGNSMRIHDAFSSDLGASPAAGSNAGSCLAVPVKDAGNVVAVLLLTARETGRFSARDAHKLNRIAPFVGRMLAVEWNRLQSASREKRMVRLNQFVDSLSRLSSRPEIFENTVRLIASEIPASLVRLATVEDGGAFLKSEALRTQRPLKGIIPADGRLILSIMPYHRLAIGSARPVLVDQENPDTRMSAAEASQALSDRLSSALIIPVIAGRQVSAIISLAEMRSAKRFTFDHPDVLFAETVARCLGMALQSMSVHRAVDIAERRRTRSTDPFYGIESMNRVKSPLTSLLGSVSLLRSGQGRSQETIERYLDIIDSSARKLGSYLEEHLSVR